MNQHQFNTYPKPRVMGVGGGGVQQSLGGTGLQSVLGDSQMYSKMITVRASLAFIRAPCHVVSWQLRCSG